MDNNVIALEKILGSLRQVSFIKIAINAVTL